MIEIAVAAVIIFVFCKFCGNHTKHRVQQDSEYWESHWCESCHIGSKFKVK